MIVKNLESVTLKTDILGKIVANNYFSGKGSQALPYKAFQIYFRNHLCW